MNYKEVFAQWSSACRDIAATQFGYFMDGWKSMEKQFQDTTKVDWTSFWKK